MSLEETIDIIKEQGAKCIVPHPYDFYTKRYYGILKESKSLLLLNPFNHFQKNTLSLIILLKLHPATRIPMGIDSAYTKMPYSSVISAAAKQVCVGCIALQVTE